ncbi:P-loop containing nucleoside triphosphate hydrolase protein [Periconia macrospinosa]|uniref:ATP-dependent DNA helicase n=1 Tax=Periconia macrospinosa TaxID=97972 RepID=A0A2V1E078_9PLEO|nr:P-loop containing nucleoside triphosphate hydrolase protein [Periconia macrospinosa]
MADSDAYDDDFDDSAFLAAATQAEHDDSPPFQPSPRPLKRQKLGQPNAPPQNIAPRRQQRNRPFVSSSDDEDLLHSGGEAAPAKRRRRSKSKNHGDVDHDIQDQVKSPKRETVADKRKNRIHVPTVNLDLTDAFCTQPPQEPSPPWKPRGAIWQKPTTSIGVHRETPAAALTSARQLGNSRQQSTPASRPGPAPQYDPTQDLEDLPSDAFASSPFSSPNGDDVQVVSERRTRVVAPQTGLRQTTLFGRPTVNGVIPQSQVNKRYSFVVDRKQEPATHHKLDPEAIKTWVYPTNLGTIRDYQFNIVHRGLFHNLLVALPTGLGKTFIAATVMLNWFRWTTEAQIIFVAPTKPLVAQQVEACFKIAGIPRSQTTMLTGGVTPALRKEEWESRRVFFMTPQTLSNDLKLGYADPKNIVLLVVDEAHRATGSYAYVEVVSFLRRFNSSFRVLALTATPGADIPSVQKVIDGLDISKVEIRTEKSLDIARFVHPRKIEKHVFTNSEEMEMCMDLYDKALEPCFKKVVGTNIFYSPNPRDVTPYGCTQGRKSWFQGAGKDANQGYKAMINTILTVLASISQSMELLKYHGIGPFYTKLKDFRDSQAEKKSKYKKEICDSDHFIKLMNRLRLWTDHEDFIGHPKLEFLQQAVLDHFVNAADGANPADADTNQTRIMIFAHFRDSAEEIVRVLKKHEPMIKPHVFVGQQNSKNSDGMGQKTQLAVIEKFKAGVYNTLVATSIGEEGLDIGEVDLIICYDSKASPIRMLQRMGRTGRKREGRIVMLQMQGKEENDAAKAKDSYEKMQELIAKGDSFAFHDDVSRRILPPDVDPMVDRRPVEIPLENSQPDWLPEPKKQRGKALKRPTKKFHMPDGVITGFVTAGRMDEEVTLTNRPKKAVKVYPSEEILEWPQLEDVVLDEAATKDLERRFQTVVDDDNDAPMVGPVDFNAQLGHQLALTKTHFLRQHGSRTISFVNMLQQIHTMDDDRVDNFARNLHRSDWETMPDHIVVSQPDIPVAVNQIRVENALWADDDPASQQPTKAKAKAAPKTKTTSTVKKSAPKAAAAAAAAPRPGRPKKAPSAMPTTPVRKPKAPSKTTKKQTPNWRVSDLAAEGGSSSPPPTDPQMRVASQAETLGSDDTVGVNEPQDTQAYRLDSDLVSFIAEDDEDVEGQVSDSSLPELNFAGLGSGTQAVVKSARPKPQKKAQKIFTSDVSDNDAQVSSDSDDDVPIQPRKRARRVIDDDEDDD